MEIAAVTGVVGVAGCISYGTEDANEESEIEDSEFQVIAGEEIIGHESTAGYEEYETRTDKTGSIRVEIPAEWSYIDGQPFREGSARASDPPRVEPSLYAESDTILSYVHIWASQEYIWEFGTDLKEILDAWAYSECTESERVEYSNPDYQGLVSIQERCYETQESVVDLVALPNDESFLINIEVRIVDERDWELLSRIHETAAFDRGYDFLSN